MVRIVGLSGLFNENNLSLMLNSLKYTNEISKNSSSGIFLSIYNNIIYNNKLCDINSIIFNNNYYKDNKLKNNNNSSHFNIALGSIFPINHDNSLQPIRYKNLTLIFNGTIYNSSDIVKFLKKTNSNNNFNSNINSSNNFNNNDIEDDLIVVNLLWNYFDQYSDLKKAVFKVNELLDGEYAYAIFDGENLAISRDKLGIIPIYYYINSSFYNVFASEKKALWKIGIDDSDICSLQPGHILYNWELFSPENRPWDKNYISKLNIFDKFNDYNNYINFNNYDINEMNYNKIKEKLLELLIFSINKRINGLDKVGLIFSGGVDSAILANLLNKNYDNLDLNLYTVGVENSQDLKYSRKIAKKHDLSLKTMIINEKLVKESLNPVLEAIEEPNLMKIGVGMTLYLATKMAFDDDVSAVLAGQGADELFGGYNRYLNSFNEKNSKYIELELINDIKNGYKVNFERDNKIANSNGVELRVPYLDETLVNFSLKIPIQYKIQSNEDKLRKKILRDIALDIGLDEEIAMRPKKAAQYGSGIHKILIKKVLKDINLDLEMNKIINK
ncbi:Amidophosphoribosyltransferase [Candidatus Methanobinarius endosymbioticus]|uniref:Amidophosphoribosyltransferase n=1 Tax=Candidatus Methanobinarius endosymbioticus TaxID=2006182 RepID=A0A366MAR3_9EURY|nr:Amidophosphoribosyltransferase [Candidatus Methanobinarius endosymbioticus]